MMGGMSLMAGLMVSISLSFLLKKQPASAAYGAGWLFMVLCYCLFLTGCMAGFSYDKKEYGLCIYFFSRIWKASIIRLMPFSII